MKNEHNWCMRASKNREGDREDELKSARNIALWRLVESRRTLRWTGILSLLSNRCDRSFTDVDNVIIDGVRYAGLYELIFKRLPNDLHYTEVDMHKYKSMLLTTNAYKHKHHRRVEYWVTVIQVWTRNRVDVDYAQKTEEICSLGITSRNDAERQRDWLRTLGSQRANGSSRLLDASHRAGNIHDNEVLPIIEEFREVGLIIN